jgi:hypothetical protein
MISCKNKSMVNLFILCLVLYLFIWNIIKWNNNFAINVRVCRRGNQKWTKKNRQHRVHKMKTNKTKTQRNMRWTPLYANNVILKSNHLNKRQNKKVNTCYIKYNILYSLWFLSQFYFSSQNRASELLWHPTRKVWRYQRSNQKQ